MFCNYEEFKTGISNSGITAKEAEFSKSIGTPNLVFFRAENVTVYANGKPVLVQTRIVVELYTEKNDNKSEKNFEHWLCENEIEYQKTERVWLTTEKWYQTIYEIWLIFDE